jgi:hypothetical protein
MTKTTEVPSFAATLVIRRDPINAKRWCIYNTYLNRVEEGGFFSRDRAEAHRDREYDLSRV